jgi:hypothetical protein
MRVPDLAKLQECLLARSIHLTPYFGASGGFTHDTASTLALRMEMNRLAQTEL